MFQLRLGQDHGGACHLRISRIIGAEQDVHVTHGIRAAALFGQLIVISGIDLSDDVDFIRQMNVVVAESVERNCGGHRAGKGRCLFFFRM